MKRELKQLVTGHAKLVRAWAEAANQRRKYNRRDNLMGWCAIASAKLWKSLDAAGIKAEIHLAQDIDGCHVFLVIEDHVVDVTATQFSEFESSKLVIMHVKEAEGHWFYQSSDIFETADDLRENQIRTGWPRHQVAYKK